MPTRPTERRLPNNRQKDNSSENLIRLNRLTGKLIEQRLAHIIDHHRGELTFDHLTRLMQLVLVIYLSLYFLANDISKFMLFGCY